MRMQCRARSASNGIEPSDHSSPWRSAAAAANGPITRLTRVSAHRIVNGVPNGTGPTIAALEAATPKISTGIVSGSTSTGSSNPPRRSATDSAAPISPMKVSAGVPASSVSATAPMARSSRLRNSAEQRRGDHQRQAGGEPMRERLGRDREFERRRAHHDQIERAVLVIGGEQPVEREQARQQRAEPQDRRADAREQREIGPDRERHQRHDDQEEQHAHQRAAADADRDAHVAHEQGGERVHAARSELQFARALEPERPMRGGDDHAAAGEMRRASGRQAASCAAASSAEVGSSSSQIGRCTAISRAIESRRRCPAER